MRRPEGRKEYHKKARPSFTMRLIYSRSSSSCEHPSLWTMSLSNRTKDCLLSGLTSTRLSSVLMVRRKRLLTTQSRFQTCPSYKTSGKTMIQARVQMMAKRWGTRLLGRSTSIFWTKMTSRRSKISILWATRLTGWFSIMWSAKKDRCATSSVKICITSSNVQVSTWVWTKTHGTQKTLDKVKQD